MPEGTEPTLNFDWTAVNEVPVSPANTVMTQAVPEGFILNIGHAVVPVATDAPQMVNVPVRVAARVLVTPGTVETLKLAITEVARHLLETEDADDS